jgi:aspartate-semialdehyde dehydrogenase
MKTYKIGIVGIGAVGGELVKILRQRNFPVEELRVFARSERDEEIAGETVHVVATTAQAFDGLDFAFFAGTEGASGASVTYGWDAVDRGVTVIDNGNDFRMDDRVPLVIPEINAQALQNHRGFVANPNCSTIIALMALAPLHREAGIERLVAATYQSVSGSGSGAITELESQVQAYSSGGELVATEYPAQIAFNVLAQIGGMRDSMPGFTSEEVKMRDETRKILGADSIRVCATCVRVPVFYSHAESLTVEFANDLSPERAREILNDAPGVQVVDDMASNRFPMPIEAEHNDDVLVGRIRRDESAPNSLSLFAVGDNIRKGAALNAIQIAEHLI